MIGRQGSLLPWGPAAAACVILALTIRGAASAPQVIATAGAPTGPRTGLIVGQVVDSTGAPVPEAVVKLTMPKFLEELLTTPKGRVMADGEGRYFFANLPSGEYNLSASKEAEASSSPLAKANAARTPGSCCGSSPSSPARWWMKPENPSSGSRCGRS